MDEAEDRKRRSEQRLSALGTSINPALPCIETADETRLRAPDEVARRLLALLSVSAVADGVDRQEVIDWLKQEGHWDAVSTRERAFLEAAEPRRREVIQASWRAECVWVLGWALRLVCELGLPVVQTSVQAILDVVPGPGESTAEFVRSAKLRPIAEVLDQSDLIYRAHWAARNAALVRDTSAGPIDEGVVREWHQAINWLTCYEGIDDWDLVTTDT